MKNYRKCIIKLYSFLVNDTALPLDLPLRFQKNPMKRFALLQIKKAILTPD